MSSVLSEFKKYQKIAFESLIGSKERMDASERMDDLWIRLSAEEAEEAQEYERSLWIEAISSDTRKE
jgi:hypothetical protein